MESTGRICEPQTQNMLESYPRVSREEDNFGSERRDSDVEPPLLHSWAEITEPNLSPIKPQLIDMSSADPVSQRESSMTSENSACI